MRPASTARRALAPLLATLFTAAALALPATAVAAGFTAHLYAPNHQPEVGAKWRIKVTATRGGRALSGTVRYRYLSYGSVVATRPGGSFTHGVYRDTLTWPGAAVGHPLTFQAVVRTRYGTVYLNWWIKVRR